MPKTEGGYKTCQVTVQSLIYLEKNATAGGAVIAADYVEYGNIKFVATTSNNNSINFWDSNNYIFRERLNTSEIQMTSNQDVFKLFSQMVRGAFQQTVYRWLRRSDPCL